MLAQTLSPIQSPLQRLHCVQQQGPQLSRQRRAANLYAAQGRLLQNAGSDSVAVEFPLQRLQCVGQQGTQGRPELPTCMQHAWRCWCQAQLPWSAMTNAGMRAGNAMHCVSTSHACLSLLPSNCRQESQKPPGP